MSGINGLRGTGDWSADERPKDFRNSILFLNPKGAAPIFALTGRAKTKPVTDPEFSWWAEANSLVRLQINGALGSGDTAVVVDSVDPGASTPAALYGTATHLKEGDILMVEPDAGATYGTPELVMVEDVQSDTTFTVRRGVGGSSAASIANDKWLLLIGSAYAEGTGVPRAVVRNPTKFTNYTQIFKDTYELTATADKTEVRTGDPWSTDKKRKMWDHSRSIEASLLFSTQKYETVGENGKPLRYTAGIRAFIPATNLAVGTVPYTVETLMAAFEPMFKQNGAGVGGDERVAFMGNKAALALGSIIKQDDSTHMEIGNKITSWGMDFNELIMPFGTVRFKTHPLLNLHPIFSSSIYVIDFSALEWKPLRGRDTKPKDDVQTEDEDVRRGFYMTEGGWMVDGGGSTMGVIDNVIAA